MISPTNSIELNTIKAGLAGSGRYGVAHESPGLELDLNPLGVPDRCIAVDARVRVRGPKGRPRIKSW
jgi:hypothetical protein